MFHLEFWLVIAEVGQVHGCRIAANHKPVLVVELGILVEQRSLVRHVRGSHAHELADSLRTWFLLDGLYNFGLVWVFI